MEQRSEVQIVDAVRTPQGRRNGGLSSVHPSDLLAVSQRAIVERTGIEAAEVGQVIGGCISQSGAQSFNIARTAWLCAGLPESVPATTIDSQCGSSQQAANLAAALIGFGSIDLAVACGVESMSLVPIGASTKAGPGRALSSSYFEKYEFISQFEAGERIAAKWGVSREECDHLGYESQRRAARAWHEGHFDAEVVPVDVPLLDDDGKPTDERVRISKDEGLRETTLEGLAQLKPVVRQNGVLTAGNSSQIADQSSALLLASARKAADMGLRPKARIVDLCLVGVDPTLMLTGPIPVSHLLLDRNGLQMSDIDVVEINEAFAPVVLAWQRETNADMEKVNPNGGAIAIGHALGSTGTRLIATAVHELERSDGEWALVTMCCGGGLGTGTLIQRL